MRIISGFTYSDLAVFALSAGSVFGTTFESKINDRFEKDCMCLAEHLGCALQEFPFTTVYLPHTYSDRGSTLRPFVYTLALLSCFIS